MRMEPMPEAAVAPAPALWLVDKAAGPTSHDVVATARRALGRKTKVGHSGTLDPFATGLLVLMVGRATRLAPYLTGLDKTYLATIQTGQVSATLDPEGPIEDSGAPATAAEIEAVLPSFLGVQLQRVPALSAVHVEGERLYKRARRGEEVELPEREIAIHSLRLVGDQGNGRAVVEVRCGAGTYVRRLAGDIGERLGCGAYCAELRRTRVGELAVEDAVPVERVSPTGGLDPLRGLGHLPARELSEEEAGRVRHGGRIAYAAAAGGVEAVTLLREGRLMAIAVPGEDGGLRPSVVLEDSP
jgi:tRNA pseudouridine55 synthase